MLEILFKGKRTYNGDWVQGSLIIEKESAYIISECEKPCNVKVLINMCSVEVDPKTVEPFTGMTDKNGTKIFRGDRVRVPMYNGSYNTLTNMIGTVVWEKSAFSVVWDDKKFGKNFIGYLENIEVIGNIHDNMELMDLIDLIRPDRR